MNGSGLTAHDLLAAFADRTLSPVEAVRACSAAAEADELGAWQALCPERALQEAREAERAWRAGAPAGPLCGVPIGIKDLFDTAGVPTECGSMLLAGRVPDTDAEAVRRVRAAGAIVLGKTTTHEFACGLTMVNERRGDTRNPFDPERTPGGSSGGSAVALATGMVPLALGTDTGGSIRWPAAACGVVGFKPSFGSVPMAGCWPLAPSLDHAGPMARDVRDARLLFEVMAGERLPVVVRPLRVGIPAPLHVDLHPAVAAALESAADALRVAGHDVREFEAFDHRRTLEAFFGVFHTEILRTHVGLGFWPARAGEYTANVRARLEIAEGVAAEVYAQASARRAQLAAQVAMMFEDVDLLLTPVCAAPVPRLDDVAAIREIVTPLTCPQDVLGLPACAVPAGADAAGVPIGVQLTGGAGRDRLVLAVAAAFG